MNSNAASGLFGSAAAIAQGVTQYMPEPIAQGVNFAASLAGAGGSKTLVDISPNYQALIDKQIEVQAELQQVSFTSNIERSKHESRMAAIRNVRAA